MIRHLLPAALAALAALVPAQAEAQASASPYTSATRYDAERRVTGTISADPDSIGSGNPFLAVRKSYDAAGRLIAVETGTLDAWKSEQVAPAAWGAAFHPLRTLETQYDAMDRKVREILREGGTAGPVRTLTQYSYDSFGLLECTAIRMNPATFASPPASACTPGTQGSEGPDRITRIVYDAAGQKLQLRGGVGTADEGAEATWAYDPNGQIVTVIDGNGNRAELRYDGHGRQDRWTFPSTTRPANFVDATPASALASAGSVNAADFEQYGYDAAGNRTSLRKRDGSTLGYQYDALNRLIVKVVPERTSGPQALTAAQTRDVYYSYDLRNLQLTARFDSPGGEGVTNSYDGFGRLRSSSINLNATTRTLSYDYDADGNRTLIRYPGEQPGQVIDFNMMYDGLNRPFYLYAGGGSGLAFASYQNSGAMGAMQHGALTGFGYDAIQRPNARTHFFTGGAGAVAWTFGRNPAGQISSIARDNDAFAWTSHYAVNRAYTTNGLNQYSAAGAATFVYDSNGNLVSDGATGYVYDVENRLVSSSVGASLVYDPLGRLYEVSRAGSTTRFLYDGDALVAEYGASGATLRRHVHWPGADVPLVSYEGGTLDTPRFLFADHQGSIVALTDAGGATFAINRYDEYGIPAISAQGQSLNTGRFQYTGQAWLDELGLYYYKARIYSPTLGRFLQTDPIGYEDQFNLYEYVGDDPVNQSDPTGRCSSIADQETQADCLEQRENQITAASEYIGQQPIRSGSDESAYVATYNEDTREVSVRQGDAAGVRDNGEVNFTDSEGNQLRARPDGRITTIGRDGSTVDTNEILLVTGHDHPPDPGGGIFNTVDRANERLNDRDRLLSRAAPAIIRGPSGTIRTYVNGRQRR